MKITRIKIAATLVIAALPVSAVAVQGYGTRSCGEWVADQQANPKGFDAVIGRQWLGAYLTGIAMATRSNVLANTELHSLGLWVTNYCKANPLQDAADAGMALFNTLQARATAK